MKKQAAAKNSSVTFDKLIDSRLRRLPDFRPRRCLSKSNKVNLKVSIILQFFDYQFYDLKTTIGSVLMNTPREHIQEIIVIDDGSTLEYIQKDSTQYIDGISFAQMYILSIQKGPAGAKMYAAEKAVGDVLVFLDGNVICSKGWLEPLLDLLDESPNSLAVPHYDDIHDPVSYEYKATEDSLVTSFTWSLTMRMRRSVHTTDVVFPLETVVMRGNAFAVKKDYFDKLGGYDDVMKDAAALAMELSFRTWLCGGSIKIVPCSRVGILALNDPLKIVNAESVRRMSELWMSDRKDFIFKNTGIDQVQNQELTDAVQRRKEKLDSLGLQCKSFDWYVSNVAKDIYTPSKDAQFYGLLKCKTGRCARVGQDARIDLGACNAETYNLHPHEMLFELDKHGFIRVDGKCLAVQSSAYVVVESCNHDESKHKWEHHPGGRLRNVWSSYCAMHVTDPDKNVPHGRQILMAQDCGLDASGSFISWEFIMP